MFTGNAKILIVDDMKSMRMLMKKQLGELGYQYFTEAEDGEKAWALVQQSAEAEVPFDLIFSDWNMPKLKGIDLLRKVRADLKTRNTPFIMVTAEVETASVQEAKASDTRASGFLDKLFTTEELRNELLRAYQMHFKKAA